jgi:hypothetical protein
MKGWITDSSRPAGRRSLADAGVVREIIRPGKYSDNQDRDGTPANRQSTKAATTAYDDPAAIKQRNAERGIGDRGLSGGTFGVSNNPTVSSKNDKRYGRGGSKLEGATFKSTGSQPAPLHRGSELAASLRGRDVSKAGTIKPEVVGHVGGKFKYPSYPNAKAKKHTGSAPSGPRAGDSGALDRADYTGGRYPGDR